MTYRTKILLLGFFALSFFAETSFAQKDIRKADKQLELKAYDLAIKNYKAYLDQNPDNVYAQLKLADAYRQVNDLMKSIYWYEKALSHGDVDPIHKLYYAQSLKKLGLYEKAKIWFGNYAQHDNTSATNYLAGCDAAIELLKREETFDLMAFDGNSSNSDFGPSLFGDKIVFSSFRKDLKRSSDKQNLSYIKNIGNQLYIAPNKEQIEESELKFLRPKFKEINGIGPVTYSGDLSMAAYTKNNFSDGAIQPDENESDLSIYIAIADKNGDFTQEYPLPYNEVEHSYAYPNLVFNGSALYFSSNRSGGFGGFDIYVCYHKDGEWTNPKNLGSKVNSPHNEITPYLTDDELFFSTDRNEGLGGYDVFHSVVTQGEWSNAENMGKGINSPADDYYFIKGNNGRSYITSNRLGGNGKDDIYIATEKSQQEHLLSVNIPKAVDLDELVAIKDEKLQDTELSKGSPKEVKNVSESEVLSDLNETNKGSLDIFESSDEFKLYDHYDLSLDGAKIIGAKESFDPTVERYFIQIASLSESKGSIEDFDDIKMLGNLYRFIMSRTTKIRLGSFDSKIDADMILDKVRGRGYKDAFITSAVLSDVNYELLNEGEFVNYYGTDDADIGTQYKVRLASYSDPLWFDTEELNYLDGNLEQWTKGYWTIFILSGFNSIEEAESAKIKAINRGFKEAEVVIDDRGVLKKINTH